MREFNKHASDAKTEAWFYRRYRDGYPNAAVDALLGNVSTPGDIAVDVGCGPGQLTEKLLERGLIVYAIDPSTEMLSEMADLGPLPSRLISLRGTAERLGKLVDRRVHLVSFARSFHLTHRRHVLEICNQLVAPRGAVGVITVERPGGMPTWMLGGFEVLAGLRQSPETLGASAVGSLDQDESTHTQVLSASAFSKISTSTIEVRQDRDLEQTLGFFSAVPGCSPLRLGTEYRAWSTALARRLRRICPTERFEDRYRIRVIRAQRP